MADKTYKMTVSLSDGSTVDAGTFVALQGPQGARGPQGPAGPAGSQGPVGPQGASGAINDWTAGTSEKTILADGTYMIRHKNTGQDDPYLLTLINGEVNQGTVFIGMGAPQNGQVTIFQVSVAGGTLKDILRTSVGSNSIYLDTFIPSGEYDFEYIKLK